MPRQKKPPRLYLHPKERVWVIRDGPEFIRTGCSESEAGGAEKQLSEYIAGKWQPQPAGKRPSDIPCATVIALYQEIKLPVAKRPVELINTLSRLNDYWGAKRVNEIIGSTCREYHAKSSTDSMARRDLEIFRAAVRLYAKEYGLDYTPEFTLPDKEEAREAFLTRKQAAGLLWAAYRSKQPHLVRYLILGLYSGTRSGALTGMQWFPNTIGGYVDLENGVMHRSAPREKKTNKRKPPATIPKRLQFWLERWKQQDTCENAQLRYIIHYEGEPVKSLKRSWNTARARAELPADITPHTMRHTSITWAMQAGVQVNEVSSYYGVSQRILEKVYWHHHPDFQKEMRGTF